MSNEDKSGYASFSVGRAPFSRRRFLAGGGVAAGGLALGSVGLGGVSPARAAGPEPVDMVVKGGRVYTMTADRMVYPDGAIAVRGSEIVAVGPTRDIEAAFKGAETVDASGRMVMPGFVDTHLHPVFSFHTHSSPHPVEGAPYAGHAEAYDETAAISGMSFNSGMPEFLRFLGQTNLIDKIPPMVTYALSLHSMMVAIRGGATTFIEGGGGAADGIAEAARAIGMRAGVAQSVLDMLVKPDDIAAGPQRVRDTDSVLALAESAFTRWKSVDDGMVTGWYNLITDVTASDELLAGIAALAKRDDAPIASHTAATRTQEEFSKQFFGKGGVTRLADHGFFETHWLGIHMGFFDDAEIDLMAKGGAHIAHCPGTSNFEGKGILRDKKVARALLGGVPVGLGSDTIGAGVVMDQIRLAFAGHKEAFGDDRVLPPYAVLELATAEAAKCARLSGVVGALEPGLKADMILVDIDTPEYAQSVDPLGRFVITGGGRDIRTSIVNGRVVMRDREFLTVDQDAVMREMRAANALLAQFAAGAAPG